MLILCSETFLFSTAEWLDAVIHREHSRVTCWTEWRRRPAAAAAVDVVVMVTRSVSESTDDRSFTLMLDARLTLRLSADELPPALDSSLWQADSSRGFTFHSAQYRSLQRRRFFSVAISWLGTEDSSL